MKFRGSFCDPFNRDIIELGDIPQEKIIETFEKIEWSDYLKKMETADESEIHYAPSLEVENKETRHGLSISAVGNANDYEFYIFYKRPKTVKRFFGLTEKLKNNYMTDVTGQTKEDALECLKALLRNDTEFLANKIGQ